MFSLRSCLKYGSLALLLLYSFSTLAKKEHKKEHKKEKENAPIVITAIENIDFGTISDDDGTCRLKKDGQLTGTGATICFGYGTPGTFLITGKKGQYVHISAIPGNSVDGITFTPKLTGKSMRRLNKREETIKAVGTLTLSNAIKGQKTLYYTIIVDYQ